MPPCPPPEPHIVEAAKRWGERMANGEKIDFKAMMKNVGMRLPELPPDPVPSLRNGAKKTDLTRRERRKNLQDLRVVKTIATQDAP